MFMEMITMGSRGVLATLFLVVAITLFPRDCDSANTTNLDFILRNYFSDQRHNTKNPDYKARARNFIISQFKTLGLKQEEHNFTTFSTNGSTITGVLNGSKIGKADDTLVGVAAHYDTYDSSPGVNDNGSGMAALLEVARLLTEEHKKGFRHKNTILFVAFDQEENSYMGSRKFKAEWLSPWIDRIYGKAASDITMHGIIVMDTVMAYNESNKSQRLPPGMSSSLRQNIALNNERGDFILNIYRNSSDYTLGTTFTRAWKTLRNRGIEEIPLPFTNVTEMIDRGFGSLLRSDHSNLWNSSIPAIFLTDTAEFRGSDEGCYHRTCDNITTMITDSNLKFLATTTDAIVETLNTLSEQ